MDHILLSTALGWIGVVNLLLAPLGAFALNLAAITAAMCMGREAHSDASRRYVAAMAAGFFYPIVGLFGATITTLFVAFPAELVAAIAGIALLGTMANSLIEAMRDDLRCEAALATFRYRVGSVDNWNRLRVLGHRGWGGDAGGAESVRTLTMLAPSLIVRETGELSELHSSGLLSHQNGRLMQNHLEHKHCLERLP